MWSFVGVSEKILFPNKPPMSLAISKKTFKVSIVGFGIRMFEGQQKNLVKLYQGNFLKANVQRYKQNRKLKSTVISRQMNIYCRNYSCSVSSLHQSREIPRFIAGGQLNQTFEYKKAKDGSERLTCKKCDFILYENPKIVVGSVVKTILSNDSEDTTKNVKYLLGKRNIQPRSGYWGLTAGYMEKGETIQDCARREALEECNAIIVPQNIIAVYSIPHISQVHIYLEAKLENPTEIKAGEECRDVGLFSLDEIPYHELAFPTGSWALYHSLLESKNRPYGNPSSEYKYSLQTGLSSSDSESSKKIDGQSLSIYDLWFNGKELIYNPSWRLKEQGKI